MQGAPKEKPHRTLPASLPAGVDSRQNDHFRPVGLFCIVGCSQKREVGLRTARWFGRRTSGPRTTSQAISSKEIGSTDVQRDSIHVCKSAPSTFSARPCRASHFHFTNVIFHIFPPDVALRIFSSSTNYFSARFKLFFDF